MKTICLLNDSFPPQIDGVSNAVLNYAEEIKAHYGNPIVVTPEYPYQDDSNYDFPIMRYKSIDVTKQLNVVAGIPYAPKLARQLRKENVDLLHCHCPVSSIVLARALRDVIDAPLVMTYHSRYEIDVRNVIKSKVAQKNILNALVEFVSSCDELWAVSKGAGESFRKLGYKGDYIVMKNGVDLPHAMLSQKAIDKVTSGYDLPDDVPVFIFAGRMMWYKGIRIIVDALAGLKSLGNDFRMVFVGNGTDFADIKSYIEKCNIIDKCIFVGAIHDREALRAWYCKADLMLFPSTFDTNGLVVREAAACSCASVLIEGSCAAEDITDGRNGYLIPENAVALAVKLDRICRNMAQIKKVGETAGNEIYLSWHDSIAIANDRYDQVIDNYRCGKYGKHKNITDEVLKSIGELMSFSPSDLIGS